MQQQNDIEELFRKSADSYPLNTNNSNWSAVEQRLKSEREAEPVILSKRRYFTFIAILFLIVSSAGSYFIVFNKNNNKPTGLQSSNVYSKSKLNNLKGSTAGIILVKPESNQILNTEKAVAPFKLNTIKGSDNSTPNSKIYLLNTPPVYRKYSDANQSLVIINRSNNIVSNELIKQQQNISLKTLSEKSIKNTGLYNGGLQHIKLKKKQVFYAGLFLAREISYVRSYETSQGNIGSGFILGFNLNRHLSLETGLSKQKKDFNTKGDNFSRDNLSLQPATTLTEVRGYFKTTVIPVNIRYNFNKGKQGQFFASTGFSTLVLHRQYYNYYVEKAGTPENLQRSYPAVKDNKLFSQVNVSAGYEKDIAGIVKLRVEPYYRLPLSSIGLGKVHLSSAGVNVGIVKNF